MPNNFDDKLIELLQNVYRREIKSYRSYFHAAVTAVGPFATVYRKIFTSFYETEQEHAREIGLKLTSFHETPTSECLSIDDVVEARKSGYTKLFDLLKSIEDETMALYEEIREYAESIGNTSVVLLAEHIIEEESEHHDEFERLLLTIKPSWV